MNCNMDFIKVELDPDGESYLTSDYGYHLTEVKQEKDPLLLSFPECEMENKHVKPILNSQPNSVSATYLTSSHSENQLIYVKEEEDPLSITLPVVKAENESLTGNEEWEDHSDGTSALIVEPQKVHITSKEYNSDGHYSADSLNELNHVNTHVLAYTNDVCKDTFSHQSKLKSRILQHCSESQSFDMGKNDFHLHNGHSKQQVVTAIGRPYSCDVCKKAFNHRGHLREHQRVHTGERPYSCDECKKTFTRQDTLKIHQRVHTGERPYSCDTCKKSFSQLGNLKLHIGRACR